MPDFQRRHYRAVADALHNAINNCHAYNQSGVEGVKIAAMHLATIFESDNVNFKRGKFLKACGVSDSLITKSKEPEEDADITGF